VFTCNKQVLANRNSRENPAPQQHRLYLVEASSKHFHEHLANLQYLFLPKQRPAILGYKPNPSDLHTNLTHLKQHSHTPPRRRPYAAPNQRAPVLRISLHLEPRPPTRPPATYARCSSHMLECPTMAANL
jgi:hypothetical protein